MKNLLLTLLILCGAAACTKTDKPLPVAASTSTDDGPFAVVANGVVGAGGGTISGGDVTLTIPPGAFSNDTRISVSAATSPGTTIYQFSPEGQFPLPIEVTLNVPPNIVSPAIYWSGSDHAGFDNLGGTVGGKTISTSVTHFSYGYVAEESPFAHVFPILITEP